MLRAERRVLVIGAVANLAGGTITGPAGGVVGYQYVTNLTNDGSIGGASGDAVESELPIPVAPP